MHVSRKVITIGPAVMILCLGLPFVSQAGSSHDSDDYRNRHDTSQRGGDDYRNRHDTSQRGGAGSRSGKNDVPIDQYSDDRRYYTDQFGDGDTMRDQENLRRDRSAGHRTDDRNRDDRPWAEMSDQELAKAVRSELSWSPFVDSDPIRVSSRQGVVTLEGTVEDKSEMTAAVENAYEAGAKQVNNQLRIQK